MAEITAEADLYRKIVHQKLLAEGDLNLVQVWFSADVLDKYRGSSAYSVVRTDTIGRLSRPRMWTLDFGIAGDDTVIHTSLSDLMHKLPEDERGHWASHAVTLPFSLTFLKTRIAPGSCIDDGDLRSW
jgi:hypothetical protein